MAAGAAGQVAPSGERPASQDAIGTSSRIAEVVVDESAAGVRPVQVGRPLLDVAGEVVHAPLRGSVRIPVDRRRRADARLDRVAAARVELVAERVLATRRPPGRVLPLRLRGQATGAMRVAPVPAAEALGIRAVHAPHRMVIGFAAGDRFRWGATRGLQKAHVLAVGDREAGDVEALDHDRGLRVFLLKPAAEGGGEGGVDEATHPVSRAGLDLRQRRPIATAPLGRSTTSRTITSPSGSSRAHESASCMPRP